jgi:hypothetical protein
LRKKANFWFGKEGREVGARGRGREREDPLGRKNKAMAKSKCRSAVRFVFFFGLLFLQVILVLGVVF